MQPLVTNEGSSSICGDDLLNACITVGLGCNLNAPALLLVDDAREDCHTQLSASVGLLSGDRGPKVLASRHPDLTASTPFIII